MSKHSNQSILEGRGRFFGGTAIMVAVIFVLAACGSKPTEPGRRFHLHGKVAAVHVNEGYAEIDHDAIPGFMDAMTMPYHVPDSRALASLAPGDEITADVVVTDTDTHLENIVTVKRATKPDPAASSDFHMPQRGDTVPDFVLVDQNGRQIHLRSFRGKLLFLTFIYTRCPFADFCPKVSNSFAQIYAAVSKQPELASKIRLLSVSFDPAHDTPSVLRTYAASFQGVTGTARPFNRWDFATAPRKELPAMAKFFGLYYNAQNGQIIHSMSTSLISPDGKILYWFHDNDWQPSELVSDAAKALADAQQVSRSKARA